MRVELWHLLHVQPKLGTIQESTTQPPSFFPYGTANWNQAVVSNQKLLFTQGNVVKQ